MSPITLFHVSEEEGIERFEPRAAVVSSGALEPLEPLGPIDPAEPVVPVVWAIDAARDAVVASSLQFSIIRMRNAQPRD